MNALILTREGEDSLSPFEGVARQLLVEASQSLELARIFLSI